MENNRIKLDGTTNMGKVSYATKESQLYGYAIENRLEWHMKNTDVHEGTRMQSKDVPEKLSEILSQTDCVIKKYVWLGE